MNTKSKPITIEVKGKKILLGTAEIYEEYGSPVYSPTKVTGITIEKINMNRKDHDKVDLT